MKKIIALSLVALVAMSFKLADGQKYATKTGNITFFSKTDAENIEAVNHKVTSAFETKTGKLQFSVLMKAFEFEKALMQEHFNENYIESDKYPKAFFDGKFDNLSAINFTKDGTYKTTVSGKLTIKDKTNLVSIPGTLTVKGTAVNTKATFKILLTDYNVSIPSVVKDKPM
jgi:polyisoprenoid-binding protein YceI